MKLGNLTKTVALSSLLVSTSSFAFNTDFLSVSTNGELDYATTANSNWSDNSGLAVRASLTLEAQLTSSIKAVVTTELKEALMASGDWQSLDLSDNKLEEMVREAYIEIKMVENTPIAFIVGKQEIAFGQNFSGLAMTDRGTNSAMSSVSRVDGVVGLTVALDTNFFNMIDSVEASLFENEAGDFEIGKMNNVSIRIGGELMENVRYSASYMNQEQAGDRKHTTSVGVIYNNGDWTAHVEALGFIDNSAISDTKFGLNTGLAYDMGHGTVAVEYSWIQDSLNQLALSYETELSEGVKIGPQGTYDFDSEEFGLGVRLSFAKTVKPGRKGATLSGN